MVKLSWDSQPIIWHDPNAIVITDTHIAKYAPKITGEVKEIPPKQRAVKEAQIKFFREVFFPFIDRHKITQVIHLGDLFDTVNHNGVLKDILWVREEFLEPLIQRNIKCAFILGNHDIDSKIRSTPNIFQVLLSGSPYEVLSQPKHLIIAGVKILLVPWILDENRDVSYAAINSSNATYCMGHLGLNGALPHGDAKDEHPVSMFAKFKLVVMGHYHNRNHYANILYPGAQQTLHLGDCPQKGFSVFDANLAKDCDCKTELPLVFHRNENEVFFEIIYNDRAKTLDQMLDQMHDMPLRNAVLRIKVEEIRFRDQYEKFLKAIDARKLADRVIHDHSRIAPPADYSVPLLNIGEHNDYGKFIRSIATDMEGMTEDRLNRLVHKANLSRQSVAANAIETDDE